MNQISTLQSWKEIATYVGRAVRTVQRWELLGLPVRRPQPLACKSAVYAIKHEVDTWLLNNPHAELLYSEQSDMPAANGGGGADPTGLQKILITDQLAARPLRRVDKTAQIEALKAIGREVTNSAKEVFSVAVHHAITLCNTGSAGLSLLHSEDRGQFFHWDAMAGVLSDQIGGTTPRHFSPCGVALDRRSPQLFAYPARYFDYFRTISIPLVEGLVIPIFVDGRGLGSLWVVSHDEDCKFNSEDVDVMRNLVLFCETAISCTARVKSSDGKIVRLRQRMGATDLDPGMIRSQSRTVAG